MLLHNLQSQEPRTLLLLSCESAPPILFVVLVCSNNVFVSPPRQSFPVSAVELGRHLRERERAEDQVGQRQRHDEQRRRVVPGDSGRRREEIEEG